MVGTAVYQLGLDSSNAAKNFSALKPGVQNTEPPRDSGAKSPAISPWMWNSGMMLRPRSAAVKARLVALFSADFVTLACDSGTIFGRDVVPEVCRINATSSAPARPGRAAAPGPKRSRRAVLFGVVWSRLVMNRPLIGERE